MDLNELMYKIHNNSQDKGWWTEERTFGEIIALCHSELSEALEEYRNGHLPTEIYYSAVPGMDGVNYSAKPEGISIELADCIIRILDYCGHAGIDIENAIQIKHNYNKTRPYRHGGKVI
jgi:NTP pyrophosphatase (non-canonical NTP hydrolase)